MTVSDKKSTQQIDIMSLETLTTVTAQLPGPPTQSQNIHSGSRLTLVLQAAGAASKRQMILILTALFGGDLYQEKQRSRSTSLI